MNGEVSELCTLTACAREALKGGARFEYRMGKYVNSERFVFVPKNRAEVIENSAEGWFGRLRSLGLNDIIMLLPRTDRKLHGFSNSSNGCIVCFFDTGNVTYFTQNWTFDSKMKLWNVEFHESEWSSAPEKKPVFDDNSAEFSSALSDIARLADKIEESFWADIFRQARDMLDGERECDSCCEDRFLNIRGIPERNRRIYCAAAKADVFGAMGSWNDSPTWSAHEKGLSEEYDVLSTKLFSEIQRALLFAVNSI